MDKLFGHLEKATFVHIHLQDFCLENTIPLLSRGHLQGEIGTFKLHKTLDGAPKKGTQVVVVYLGIDGTSCNLSGWRDFLEKF